MYDLSPWALNHKLARATPSAIFTLVEKRGSWSWTSGGLGTGTLFVPAPVV